ncbi:hypothetical protein LBMAG27_21220 [Bacteroidota bacterium]|nr:hypothetical protein LBMAG27_21220 [Bacteroidota bacterium]
MTSTGSGDVKLSSGGSTLTIGGNYSQSGGTLSGSSSNNSSAYLNITGNFNLSGGILEQLGNAGSNAGFFVNLSGNFSHTGGTLTDLGNPNTKVDFTFNNSGAQTFTASGNTVTGNINYTVNSGSILDLGTNIVKGNNFTVNSGGQVIFGSTAGISSSGTTGNIQVSGTRTLSTTGNYTFNGSSAQVTGAGLPATINNLTINNAAGVTLSQTVAITGTLTLTSGKITTGNYELNITNTSASAISGYSSSNYINGNLRRSVNTSGSYYFPVGTTTNYQQMNVNFTSQTGVTSLLVYFNAASPGTPTGITVSGVAVNNMLNYGYWTMTPNSAMSGGTYTATGLLTGYTNTGLNTNTKYYLLKRVNSSNPWQALGTQITVNGQSSGSPIQFAASGLTGFSDFGGGYGGGSTLPITLSLLNVSLVDNEYVNLEWITSAELNNEYFAIERSADGKDFETIGRVEGHGTSLVKNEYSFRDENPLEGTSYYRLKQVDFDGPFSYSPIQSLNNAQVVLTADDVNVFPNPATTEINVAVQMKKEGDQEIQIIDLSGRVVYSQSQSFYEGQNQFKLPLENLPTGFYFVKFGAEGQTPVLKKFLKN